jgi:hypothetical protein
MYLPVPPMIAIVGGLSTGISMSEIADFYSRFLNNYGNLPSAS